MVFLGLIEFCEKGCRSRFCVLSAEGAEEEAGFSQRCGQ